MNDLRKQVEEAIAAWDSRGLGLGEAENALSRISHALRIGDLVWREDTTVDAEEVAAMVADPEYQAVVTELHATSPDPTDEAVKALTSFERRTLYREVRSEVRQTADQLDRLHADHERTATIKATIKQQEQERNVPTKDAWHAALHRIATNNYHNAIGLYDHGARDRDIATLEATIKQQEQELRVVNLNERRIIDECDAAHRKVRQYEAVVGAARKAQAAWRNTPMPLGLPVHELCETMDDLLAALSALDTGKEG